MCATSSGAAMIVAAQLVSRTTLATMSATFRIGFPLLPNASQMIIMPVNATATGAHVVNRSFRLPTAMVMNESKALSHWVCRARSRRNARNAAHMMFHDCQMLPIVVTTLLCTFPATFSGEKSQPVSYVDHPNELNP